MRTLRWQKNENWIVRRPVPPTALIHRIPSQALLLVFAILTFAPAQHQITHGTFAWSSGNVLRVGSVALYILIGAFLAFYNGGVRRVETAFQHSAAVAELDAADAAVARYSLTRLRMAEVTPWMRDSYEVSLDRALRQYIEGLHTLAVARVRLANSSQEAIDGAQLSQFARALIEPDPLTDIEIAVRRLTAAFESACERVASAVEH